MPPEPKVVGSTPSGHTDVSHADCKSCKPVPLRAERRKKPKNAGSLPDWESEPCLSKPSAHHPTAFTNQPAKRLLPSAVEISILGDSGPRRAGLNMTGPSRNG